MFNRKIAKIDSDNNSNTNNNNILNEKEQLNDRLVYLTGIIKIKRNFINFATNKLRIELSDLYNNEYHALNNERNQLVVKLSQLNSKDKSNSNSNQDHKDNFLSRFKAKKLNKKSESNDTNVNYLTSDNYTFASDLILTHLRDNGRIHELSSLAQTCKFWQKKRENPSHLSKVRPKIQKIIKALPNDYGVSLDEQQYNSYLIQIGKSIDNSFADINYQNLFCLNKLYDGTITKQQVEYLSQHYHFEEDLRKELNAIYPEEFKPAEELKSVSTLPKP